MKKKKEKLFGKIVLYVILFMVVIGFTLPSFMDDEPQQQTRICKSDTDCYMECEEPQPGLCYLNICQQNSCGEGIYQQTPKQVELEINVNGEKLDLRSYFVPGNFFATFDQDSFQVYADLNLNHVLDKLQMSVNSECISIRQQLTCGDLEMTVNGEVNYAYGDYVFTDEDKIVITI